MSSSYPIRWTFWLVVVGLVIAAAGSVIWLEAAVTWRFPALLWGLLLVPLLVAVEYLGRLIERRRDQAFGHHEAIARLTVGRSRRSRRFRQVLRTAGTALLVLALAGPQYGTRSETVKKQGVDLVVALDFSKSMYARDVLPDRIRRAKAELTDFFHELTGDRVGLVAFAGDTLQFPMTTDYAALELFLSDLSPNDMPVGGTAIGRALTAAQRLLERSQPQEVDEAGQPARSQVVLLFTDGEDHEGDPQAAAAALSAAGVRLFTVGIGSAVGEPVPTYADDGTWTGYLRDEADNPVTSKLSPESERVLRALAEQTGGKYIRAEAGGVGIAPVRQEIRSLKQRELEARRITIQEDRYAWILLPAFLVLLLEALLPEARRRRLIATVASSSQDPQVR